MRHIRSQRCALFEGRRRNITHKSFAIIDELNLYLKDFNATAMSTLLEALRCRAGLLLKVNF